NNPLPARHSLVLRPLSRLLFHEQLFFKGFKNAPGHSFCHTFNGLSQAMLNTDEGHVNFARSSYFVSKFTLFRSFSIPAQRRTNDCLGTRGQNSVCLQSSTR